MYNENRPPQQNNQQLVKSMEILLNEVKNLPAWNIPWDARDKNGNPIT